jgi:hypothetical protein
MHVFYERFGSPLRLLYRGRFCCWRGRLRLSSFLDSGLFFLSTTGNAESKPSDQ